MGCGVWAAMTPGLVARTPDFSTDVETFRNEIKIEKEEGRLPNFGIMILFFGASHFFIFLLWQHAETIPEPEFWHGPADPLNTPFDKNTACYEKLRSRRSQNMDQSAD